jgi:GxxExxY protein
MAEQRDREWNENAAQVVDGALKVHREFGPGVYEFVYEVSLAHELKKRRLGVERQVSVPIDYDDIRFDEGFRADVVVENKVILELKAVESVLPVHRRQLLTYLRLTRLRLGLLINFNEELLKNGIHRVVNRLPE